jgi:uncharacterized protein YecT (DUF1311 family)
VFAFVILIAAAASCDANLPQTDLTACWSNVASLSNAALAAKEKTVTAGLRAIGVDAAPFGAVEKAWQTAQSKTCSFEEGLYQGGSIAPMMYAMCEDRMARARSERLTRLLDARQRGPLPSEMPASTHAAGTLDRFNALLEKQDLTATNRAALGASGIAWKAYRDEACALEGGACLSELDEERVTELQAGWIGEPFW